MPQVKELKELDVAGSATNEWADTEAVRRIMKISSYLPLFMPVLHATSTDGHRLRARSVTGYEQR